MWLSRFEKCIQYSLFIFESLYNLAYACILDAKEPKNKGTDTRQQQEQRQTASLSFALLSVPSQISLPQKVGRLNETPVLIERPFERRPSKLRLACRLPSCYFLYEAQSLSTVLSIRSNSRRANVWFENHKRALFTLATTEPNSTNKLFFPLRRRKLWNLMLKSFFSWPHQLFFSTTKHRLIHRFISLFLSLQCFVRVRSQASCFLRTWQPKK